MSKEFATPLSLELKSSQILKYFLLAVHLLAVFAVLYANIAVLFKVVSCLFITFSYVFYTKVYRRRVRLVWMAENQWFVYFDDEDVIEAELTAMSFIISWLVVLALKAENGKRVNVVIPFDALEQEIFRRLKVKLVMLKSSFFQSGNDQEF